MNNTISITEVKSIINISNNLNICKYDLFDNIKNSETNFEVDNYTFITESDALDEVINTYSYDNYILGCFNADFIEDFITLDYDSITTLQESEQFEVIGKLIINSGNLNDMMEEYIRLDGYGHALNSYDGNNDEITINNIDYIVYRNN